MQGFDLPGNHADDQPGFAHFDQENTLPGANHQPAHYFHRPGMAKRLAPIQTAQQPGASKKQADDRPQTQKHLQDGDTGSPWRLRRNRLSQCQRCAQEKEQPRGGLPAGKSGKIGVHVVNPKEKPALS